VNESGASDGRRRLTLRKAVLLSVVIGLYFVAIVSTKYSSAGLDPFNGPVWLLGLHEDADNLRGGLACGSVGLALAAVVFRPNRYTAGLLVISLLIRFYVGFWACAVMGA
jgi:hypothetical protein